MTVFAYNPESAKQWANSVVNFISGGSDSISAISKQFTDQMEKLVGPHVWTGAAAAQNYKNFLETHQALVTFSNQFGEAFSESMNSINRSVEELEISNLGVNTNVGSTFGSLTFAQLSALSEENINVAEVRYDYNTIISIGTALNQIFTSLESLNTNLTTKINELNNGSAIWDGTSAENAKQKLFSTLTTNMNKVMENLKICIGNISKAAEAAQVADRG